MGAPPGSTGPGKPAWRNLKPPSDGPVAVTGQDTNFPTAAEVAQGWLHLDVYAHTCTRLISSYDLVHASREQHRKQLEEAHEAQQHALQEQADAFRGVHLNPNAHHWDEVC
jgi:serine/arginine repetitive matrix protein 2